MIKAIAVILFVFLFISCNDAYIDKNETIRDVKTQIVITGSDSDVKCHHVYFENINDKSGSKGFNIFNLSEDMSFNIFPGIYNIYCYGLADKTLTSKKAVCYSSIKNIKLFNKNNLINHQMIDFIPYFILTSDGINAYLKIYIKDYYELFSLSSVSVKQNTQSYKSINFVFDQTSMCYNSVINIIEKGAWYMNISYSVKSRIDKDALDDDNIYISTNYISDVFLTELID